MTITDEPTRLNFIGRLEQERLGIANKAEVQASNYHAFLLKNLNHVVGLVFDHRDQAAFLHTREGHRAGTAALECAAKEIDWALAELRRQSQEFNESNQLTEAA